MTELFPYIGAHWSTWLVAVLAALFTWVATNIIGRPLVTFWSDRRRTLEVVQEHASVDWSATQERVSVARHALRGAAATMSVYAQGGPIVVRAYCWLRRYHPALAGRALICLHDLVGEGQNTGTQKNNADAVRLLLGASARLSRQRVHELRRMIDKAYQYLDEV